MYKEVPGKDGKKVGGQLFEELFFEFIEKKYNFSKKDFLKILEEKQNINTSIPISILNSDKLSSLESIVKYLRENRNLSYIIIGMNLNRNPKTLAVTYAIAHRKMPELFSKDFEKDKIRIPFTVFSQKLSVLESICNHLKSQGRSFAEISRLLNKDQRTIWTVCKRAERKLKVKSDKTSSEKIIEKSEEKTSDKSSDKSSGKVNGR